MRYHCAEIYYESFLKKQPQKYLSANDIRMKLAAIPEQEPDEDDIRLIGLSKAENDDSTMLLDSFKASLEGYGGKILLRVPKSLHKRLVEEAITEGVSLNQYALCKLSR